MRDATIRSIIVKDSYDKSMASDKHNRVLVTGGGTYLGINIAAALLAEGADVTLILREGTEHRLGSMERRVRWYTADVWDVASLKGRARGHGTVIHTVGSMVSDPTQGFTYHRLNVVSARNAASMCVSDGVPHFVLMSTVAAPWISRRYVRAKRDAEDAVKRMGIQVSVIRAPVTFIRGARRPLFYKLMTFLGRIPPLSWTYPGSAAPMPLDILARGVARIALNPPGEHRNYHAQHLRRLNKRDEIRGNLPAMQPFEAPAEDTLPFETLDEDTPFGWIPTDTQREE
jgi:uncharacterized protein YbjT (DUF2867 family)